MPDYTEMLELNTGHVPQNTKEEMMDLALAHCAVNVALRRHAGTYAEESDPVMGIMAGAPIGRDLRSVKQVVCVGGIFVHTPEEKARQLVELCFADTGISLLPEEEPRILLDRDYIFYALGVLGKHYPDMVLNFMKEHYK